MGLPFSRFLFPFSVLLILAGCSSGPTTRPSSVSQRADEAIRDPFGYKPASVDRDVSGGDLGHFDKDAMRKDLNDVLNP